MKNEIEPGTAAPAGDEIVPERIGESARAVAFVLVPLLYIGAAAVAIGSLVALAAWGWHAFTGYLPYFAPLAAACVLLAPKLWRAAETGVDLRAEAAAKEAVESRAFRDAVDRLDRGE
jgi:hypothetical protein